MIAIYNYVIACFPNIVQSWFRATLIEFVVHQKYPPSIIIYTFLSLF